MTAGYATAEGTQRFTARFPAQDAAEFYRTAAGLHVSNLGLGTYLGELDERTDRGYEEAVTVALRNGINFFDSAINYRHQRSERNIGAALEPLFHSSEFRREQVVVCTKAGFLTPGAVNSAVIRPEDVVGNMHSMAPGFLADQIDRSRSNLGLDTLDVFYLHNPETQLSFVSQSDFEQRIRRAFSKLEQLVAGGKIRHYGAATWDGLRKAARSGVALNLVRLLQLAREEGGEEHHFRFIQLPFNLAMAEAFTDESQVLEGKPASTLGAARRAGLIVVASATLMQAKLSRDLPEALSERLPGMATDAQRAIQFTRSTPGITVALVGMSNAAHVLENAAVSAVPPASLETYLRIYQQAE